MTDELFSFGMGFKVSRELPPTQKFDFGDDRNIEAIGEYGMDRFVIGQPVEIVDDDIGVNQISH